MSILRTTTLSAALLVCQLPVAHGQTRPDPAKIIWSQQESMARLAFMDGIWRGIARTSSPNGEKHEITQTERIGPFLGGSVKVIEGRGYDASGRLVFNSFGTISFNPTTQAFTIRSHAMGNVGDFALVPSDDGFTWEIPAGPVVIRYTAKIKGGLWQETGDRIAPGKEPSRFFEMTLHRIGDTDWPSSGAIEQK